ncbi:MAG: AIR synthase family protein [Candidatus Eisenbacteria bacterium]
MKNSMDERIEGKIPHGLLTELLSKLTRPGKEVVIGPEVGEDAFAASVDRTIVVASTDPITFTTEHIGYYAVNVNANDVATMGATPRWFLATALVPPGTGKRVLSGIFRDLDSTCVGLGIRLCGGHTEVTSAVKQTVVVGAMMGTVSKRDLVRPERARQGDRILLTKRLAVEGTAIIAREKRRVVDRVLGRTRSARARKLLFSPGISVVREALSAVKTARIHAMHDPTEGGLLWGLKELSFATGIGFRVDLDSVPVYDETRLICEHFDLDPFGLIASGSLLIVVSPRSVAPVTRAIRNLGIECTEIGRMEGKKAALFRNGKPIAFPPLKSDEISRIV